MKIDVVIVTKNSENTIEKTLKSIFKSDIPVNKIIIIDSSESRKTIEIAKEFNHSKLRIIWKQLNLAKARELGIKLVRTKWFAFIDSDAVIPKDWFSNISEYKKYGNALESWDWNWTLIPDNFYGVTKDGKKFVTSYRDQKERAYTIATLIETKYVKSIRIPEDLFFLEDEFIRRFLEKRGGTWIKTGVKIDHYPRGWPRTSVKMGRLYAKYKFVSFRSLLLKVCGNIIFRKYSQAHFWKIIYGYMKYKIFRK